MMSQVETEENMNDVQYHFERIRKEQDTLFDGKYDHRLLPAHKPLISLAAVMERLEQLVSHYRSRVVPQPTSTIQITDLPGI